ncbi:PREDICTED: tetraspanin-9 [Chrysochloris asiatica]|uniref:Tetraspanin-9 n=1 Tax=Chrysochloris asiatica TaxID=185453 RepID=A0A9B0WPV0_CHRAS|nr:PREDICTED: tetraspanin-9 [Chrysochloris asiatica]
MQAVLKNRLEAGKALWAIVWAWGSRYECAVLVPFSCQSWAQRVTHRCPRERVVKKELKTANQESAFHPSQPLLTNSVPSLTFTSWPLKFYYQFVYVIIGPSVRIWSPWVVLTVNILYWLCGCGLLGVGIWLSVSQGNFATFSPSFPSLSAANLVIAIGTIVMVTGFLGCLGAIKENKCLLLSFFIVLLVILLAELILLILFFVYMDKVNENAKKDLKEGLQLYNTENNVGLKNAWNIIQAEMRCCGVTDYTDWYSVLGENMVPDRCCMENSQGCGQNTTTPLWRTGCYEKVKMWFDDNKHVLGTVGMCILIMQILGMAFSMTLFQHIHRTGKKYDA